ncbi:MAG: hypothetical protein M8353_05920 [ANME-2 cluster archaeon]|nr:hypothetical protein [ANME-2 cluster archaeon]
MKRKVYIDGANVAHENKKTIRISRIEKMVHDLQKVGAEPEVLIQKYKCNQLDDKDAADKLIEEGLMTIVKHNDDIMLITCAYETDSFLVTNDKYVKERKQPWWTPGMEVWASDKIIRYESISGDIFIPLDVQHRLMLDFKEHEMSIPDFKAHATNGGVSPNISLEEFPESVKEMLKLIQEKSDEITYAALGSQLKTATGYKPNDLFGNAKHAARFLESRGYSTTHNEGNTYVKGVAA